MKHQHSIDTLILTAYCVTDAINAIASCNILSKLLKIRTKILVLNSDISTGVNSGISVDDWTILMGSNKNFEFSGWQEGINYCRQKSINHCGILFANDTIGRHHHNSHFAQCNLNELIRHWSTCHGAQFIGIEHFSSQPLELLGHDVTKWICTMIFGLTLEALERMDYKVDYIEYVASMCCEKKDGFSILNQNTPSKIKAYIEDWLLNGGWHGSRQPPLSANDQQRLQHKASCILCEKMLIVTARQKNISIIGVKDLEHAHARHGALRQVIEYAKTIKAKILHRIKYNLHSPQGGIQ
jgi:hypothetical protein